MEKLEKKKYKIKSSNATLTIPACIQCMREGRYIYIERERETDRQTERERDRETDREKHP